MKTFLLILFLHIGWHVVDTFQIKGDTCSLTVNVTGLRNNKGFVMFALYNTDGSLPDEHYKNFYRLQSAEIANHSSKFTFKNLSAGKYAVNVLHDEDENQKIKKGVILPKEGIGFSNFEKIGPLNKPNYEKASFVVEGQKDIEIEIIYF
ncbi:DUF2141 domain-containing protein [Draconibacterium sediminis]|uniref:DUF2141 domain-containing protein n=1 Tax=Draconibacterium sediminis TaxID=1544798 RepID=UPI0009E21993|nr:DUF2141 domain-containing protein [Draconibacterium sediminis]